MLSQLTINNYAIVDHLDIELNQGMSVITGETGAGKSIMLDALGLSLGDRADKEVIRTGAERADISACFEIEGNKQAILWLKENDFDANECILRRVITKEGRSKAYINGQPTTLSELKALGEMLIDIHSQHEHQSLLKTATHQRLLDEYCKLQTLGSEVREIADKWRKLNRALEATQLQTEDNNAQFQLISYQAKELDELALGENELAELEEEHSQLSHAESSLSASQEVLDLCSDNEDNNIQQALNKSLSILQTIPHGSKQLDEASALLNNALIQVEEASSELSHSIAGFSLNPERLESVEQRLSNIHQLARKHRVNPKEIVALHKNLSQQLEGMAHSDVKIEAMQNELAKLLKAYHEQASALSISRQKGGLKLEKAINTQLTKLGMENAIFSLALNTETSAKPTARGYENIEFLVSTNPGQTPRAMIKVASGGELSRISLAIQVVTAQTSSIPSLVFDEVDVGIGGGVAISVGELLRLLGDKGQVLCVTHQAQVASQGHHHLYVSKSSGKNSTATEINYLSEKEKVKEVARMLGGDDLSESSLAHAAEMMAIS
jgi:DNA repair protein RecN (Recombination protein N)